MTTTLSEGVKVPDVGSVNWAGDLEVNWNLLNGALANLSGNVKLDRDNTWTGEQSFTLPIVGSITGTASKAIADEDGTNIKTGYGKLAGNNTWTGTNIYTGASAIRFNNTSYVSGTPSGNIFYSTVQWGGYVNNTWSAPFTINNAVRTNGYNDTSFRTYSQTSNTLTGFVHETNADASDIAFRPIANGTHKLGTSSYQWSAVYAQSYYYNGTEFQSKFVTTDTIQTINASKIINSAFPYLYIKNPNKEKGVAPSDRQWGRLNFTDKNNATIAGMEHSVYSNGVSQLAISINNLYSNGALNPSGTSESCAITLELSSSGEKSIVSGANASTDLGTSTNKWKTLNGINPGALSLPNNSNAINLDTTNWGVSGELNHYAPTINGWLCISVKGGANNGLFLMDTSSGFGQSCYGNANETVVGRIKVALPVIASRDVLIIIHADSNSDIYEAKLYPCLGNV